MLLAIKNDLLAKTAGQVDTSVVDLTNEAVFASIIESAHQALGGIDTVLIAYGVLGDQKLAENDFVYCQKTLATNFTSVVGMAVLFAKTFFG